ncbi:MAG: MFS transporter, partial [Acidobacteriota bacterium]
ALSGYLVQFGPSYPIFAAAGFSAASIVATAVLLPPSPAVQAEGHQWDWRAYTGPLRDRMVASRFFQFFLSQFAISTFFSGFALFAERRFTHGGLAFGTREVGYTFAYLGLVGIVFQGALGPLVKRAGESRLVQSGFGLAACSFALLVRAQGLVGVATAMTLFAVGTAVLRPNLTGLISQRTARHQQGVMLGLMQSLQSLAQIVAPMAGGALIEGRWLREWALVGGVACVVGFFAAAGRR